MEILLTNKNASKEIIQENLERKLSTQFRLYVSLNHASVYMVQTLDYNNFLIKNRDLDFPPELCADAAKQVLKPAVI
jgi:hypothetical protein